MLSGITSLLADWFALEPSAGLMMFAAAALLVAATFARWRKEQPNGGLILSFQRGFVQGFLFLGIVGAFYFLLTASYKSFRPLADALAEGEEFRQEVKEAQEKWGGPIFQGFLEVTQTFRHEEVQQVAGPNNSTGYINRTLTETVDQESITRFDGSVDIQLVDPALSTYTLDARYEFDVANQTDMETVAHFVFPIDMGRMYRNLMVVADGQDVGSNKRITNTTIEWDVDLKPHQEMTIVISFGTQGMKSFAFLIREKRPIHNLQLAVDVDMLDIATFTRPDSSAIVLNSRRVENGYSNTWTISNAIIAPYLGVTLKPGTHKDRDQERVLALVKYMPRGLMLLMIVLAFTHLLFSIPLDAWRLSLFAAIFSGTFIALMGLDLMEVTHPFILPLVSLPAGLLMWMIYRRLPRLPVTLILSSAALFMLGYPHAGLLPDGTARIAFDGFTQALVILYIFVLAFYVRVRRNARDT